MPGMLLSDTQPMPILVPSTPHRFVEVMQQGLNESPATAGTGHKGAGGGGGMQTPPLSVPHVLVAGSAQQAGGSMIPGTCGVSQRAAPHASPEAAGAAAAPACGSERAPAPLGAAVPPRGEDGVPVGGRGGGVVGGADGATGGGVDGALAGGVDGAPAGDVDGVRVRGVPRESALPLPAAAGGRSAARLPEAAVLSSPLAPRSSAV
jgi:hypothetical protein